MAKQEEVFLLIGTPLCMSCGKPLKNYTPTKGRFKGQEQQYSWIHTCNCVPKDIILSRG